MSGLLLVGAIFFAGCSKKRADAMGLPATSTQALVVSAATVASTSGSLAIYQRDEKSGAWHLLGEPFPVSLGRHGLASAEEMRSPAGIPAKNEGDGATPIGIFPLESAFGRADAFPAKIPYLTLVETTEAVDDSSSRFYNRIVNRTDVSSPDWKSSEQMYRSDFLYDLGVVVGYNTHPVVPGKGSCIFLHIWKAPGAPTSGCVAMARSDLDRIVKWLDPAAQPVIAIRISSENLH